MKKMMTIIMVLFLLLTSFSGFQIEPVKAATTIKIESNQSYTLSDENWYNCNGGYKKVWTSSNYNVADVYGSGTTARVTSKQVGTAVITCQTTAWRMYIQSLMMRMETLINVKIHIPILRHHNGYF